jgi:hypothetical protein
MDSLVWAFTDLFNRGAVDLSESEFGETMLTSAELKTETARDDEVSMLDSSRGWL